MTYVLRAAVLLVIGLSAKPLLYAQGVPSWVTYLGELPTNESFGELVIGPGGDYYAAGHADVPGDDGVVLGAIVARANAGGDHRWDARLTGPAGEPVFPFGVAVGDSVVVAVSASRDGGRYSSGVLYLVRLGRDDGGPSAARRVDLSTDQRYIGFSLAPIPGSRDVLIEGIASGAGTPTTHFLARVRPDGTVAWRRDGGTLVTRLFASATTGYALEPNVRLRRFDLATGAPLAAVPPPFEGEAYAFGGSVATLQRDTVWWVRSGFEGVDVAAVVDGVATAWPRAEVDASRLWSLYDVYVDAEGAHVYGAPPEDIGGAVAYLHVGRDGREVARAERSLDLTRLSQYSPPLRGAVADPGGVLVLGGGQAGRDAPGLDGTDAVIQEVDFSRTSPSWFYRFGQPGPAGRTNLGEVVARVGGGAYAFTGRFGDRLRVSVLDADGAVSAERQLAFPLGKLYGANALPDGSAVAVATASEPDPLGGSIVTVHLVHVRPDGSTEVLRPRTQDTPFLEDDVVFPGPGGLPHYWYRVLDFRGTQQTDSLVIARIGADLRTAPVAALAVDEGYGTIHHLRPIGDTGDIVLAGRVSTSPNGEWHLTRVGADGTVGWRATIADADDPTLRIEQLVFPTPDRVAVVSGEGRSYAVDLTDGGGLDVTTVDFGGGGDTRDELLPSVRGADSTVFAWRRESTELLQRDLRTDALRIYGPFPSAPRDYRAAGPHQLVYGTASVGSGSRVFVAALGRTSGSPAFGSAPLLPLAPNPARPGQTLRLGGDDIPDAPFHLYDALGRRVATVLANAGRLLVPEVAPGVYRLVGTGADGRAAVGTLVVE